MDMTQNSLTKAAHVPTNINATEYAPFLIFNRFQEGLSVNCIMGMYGHSTTKYLPLLGQLYQTDDGKEPFAKKQIMSLHSTFIEPNIEFHRSPIIP